VLDISKTLMYDYHYNVMRKHYRNKIKLMYADTGKYIKTILQYMHNILPNIINIITDSLIYHIETEDFYADLATNDNLLDRMDTANSPVL